MRDRKLRAIGALSFISGLGLVIVSVILFWLKLSSQIALSIMIVYTIIQFRLASIVFNGIYKSRFLDFPSWLQKKYPPPGFDSRSFPCDVLLLRTPSAVLSAPDCGESLGLGYLASILRREGYKVCIIDARLQVLDSMQVVELVLAYNPPALGINLNFQYLAPSTNELIRALRVRGYMGHITLGGLYASVAAELLMEKMPEVDTIVRFEGEETYLGLIASLKDPEKWPGIKGLIFRSSQGSVQVNPLRPLITDISAIPHPARDFLPVTIVQGGYGYVLSSRGCKGACAYCVQQRSVSEPVGRRWRGRNVGEVVDEIEKLVRVDGVKNISFVDDDFIGPGTNGSNHAYNVAQEIVNRGIDVNILISVQPRDVKLELFSQLKKAGLKSVILAVDNFSQPVLDRFAKYSSLEDNLHSIEVLRKLDIDAYLGIIMFDPQLTLEELEENIKHLISLPFIRPWQILSKLEIYYGSPLTSQLSDQRHLVWDGFFAKYDFLDARIQNVYKALEEVVKLAYPSMAELDRFRWGNLEYSKTDQAVIDRFPRELFQINTDLNNEIFEIALDIIGKLKPETERLPVTDLLDKDLEKRARWINQQTLESVKQLRRQAHHFVQSIVEA